MGDWAKRRSERIRTKIPIVQVLADYGYQVDPSGGDREQQFSCNLHGDGRDGKPSARVYPVSNSWYCFACGVSRDAIKLVREREGLDWARACSVLERKYGLPPLPKTDDDDADETEPESTSDKVRSALNPTRSFADDRARLVRLLEIDNQERALPMLAILRLWEALDRVDYGLENKVLSESQAHVEVLTILERRMAAVVETSG